MKEVKIRPEYSNWRLSREEHESRDKTKILYTKFREIKDADRAERLEK